MNWIVVSFLIIFIVIISVVITQIARKIQPTMIDNSCECLIANVQYSRNYKIVGLPVGRLNITLTHSQKEILISFNINDSFNILKIDSASGAKIQNFGINGVSTSVLLTPTLTQYDVISNQIISLKDDSFLIAGWYRNFPISGIILAKYNFGGSLSTSFGGNNTGFFIIETTFEFEHFVGGLFEMRNDNILLGYSTYDLNIPNNAESFLRLTDSFGIIIEEHPIQYQPSDLFTTIDVSYQVSNEEVLVAGISALDSTEYKFLGIAKLIIKNGLIDYDEDFGTFGNGRGIYDISPDFDLIGIAQQSDGKVLIAYNDISDTVIKITRFLSDGATKDINFGVDGIFKYSFADQDITGTSMILQQDDTIVLTGNKVVGITVVIDKDGWKINSQIFTSSDNNTVTDSCTVDNNCNIFTISGTSYLSNEELVVEKITCNS